MHGESFLQLWRKNTMIALEISETGATSARWRKWFTDTGETITVTSQIHGLLCY